MTVSIAIVCEAPADRVTIATLAERVIREAATWIEPESVGDYVEWRGFRRTDTHLEWTGLDPLADQLKLLIRFRDVHPLHTYAQNALRAIRVVARSPDRADAIILVADSDTDLERMKGLVQARDYARAALPIVIGLAHTKRECWHVAGFEPRDEAEIVCVRDLRQALGFNPCEKSELLTAKHDYDKLSAKRILKMLSNDDPAREHSCLCHLPLPELSRRGVTNGLAEFLAELRQHLVPLFVSGPPA